MPPLLIYGLGFVALTTTSAGAVELVARRRRADRDQRASVRERLLRPGGFRRWVAAAAERARIEVNRLVSQRDRTAALAKRATGWSAAITEALQKGRVKSRAWITAGALGFAVLWALAVKTEVGVDARAFHGLGYGNQMAFSLALLTTLVFCVLGIVLSDLIGLTHLLPAIGTTTATTRVALIGMVTLVFAVCLFQLPRLAEYRSEAIAEQVVNAENAVQALNLLPASQRPPVVVSQANKALAAAKARLATARYVDKRLAIGAATLEGATSWATAWTVLLIAQLLLGATAAAGNWRAGVAQTAITDVNQRFYAQVAEMAVDLEIDRGEVEAALREAQVPPAPVAQNTKQPPATAPGEPPSSTPAAPPPTTDPSDPDSEQVTVPAQQPESEAAMPTPSWNAF
jgi:hypothetical protein